MADSTEAGSALVRELSEVLLGEVEATCDRVVFVKEGRTIHELSLRETAAALEVEIKIDRADAAILEGLGQFGSDVILTGGVIRLRANHEDALPEIASWLVGRGVRLSALGSRRKSLEEWFIEVMGEDQRPG